MLNIVDDVTRECLAAIPDTSISGRRVTRELTDIIAWRGKSGLMANKQGAERYNHNRCASNRSWMKIPWQVMIAKKWHKTQPVPEESCDFR